MGILWIFYGDFMEILWGFYGDFMGNMLWEYVMEGYNGIKNEYIE